MRKILLVFVVLVMMIALGACSSPPADGDSAAGKGTNGEENENGETGGEKGAPGRGISVVPGDEVLNAAGVRIVYLGMDEEDIYPGLAFEVENNGAHSVNIQTADVLVNDVVEGFPSFLNLGPGEKQPDGHRQLVPEDVDIAAIEKISLRFIIFKTESWEEIYQSEIISMEQF